MHILLTNDDGIAADGFLAAYEALIHEGHQVTACAPDRERSAQSQSITLRGPIIVEPRTMPDGALGFATSGTPADCARVGIAALAKEPVDLVVSGINNDNNLGYDINYSGTVAAAVEAASAGYPSLAVSTGKTDVYDWKRIGKILASLVDSYTLWRIPQGVTVNVNIPVEASPLGQRDWIWTRPHPAASQDYYSIKPLADGKAAYQRLRADELDPALEDSDISHYENGRVTLSPILPHGCHLETLARLLKGQEG